MRPYPPEQQVPSLDAPWVILCAEPRFLESEAYRATPPSSFFWLQETANLEGLPLQLQMLSEEVKARLRLVLIYHSRHVPESLLQEIKAIVPETEIWVFREGYWRNGNEKVPWPQPSTEEGVKWLFDWIRSQLQRS
ncbi:hypothetical protein J7L13_00110 [bacterium]|nr:hypothetical protein [bacterium]